MIALLLAATLVSAVAAHPPSVAQEHPRTPSTTGSSALQLYEGGVPFGSPSAAPNPASSSASLVREGRALYEVHCVTCHGANLEGSANGPSLANAGGAAVNFYVGTGRMPLAGPSDVQAYHENALFDAHQTDALDAYVSAQAKNTTPIPHVVPNATLLSRGRTLFAENCQACHGTAAQGATAGYGWIALPLWRATPTQIGEAIRIGPGMMPVFTPATLSDTDDDAIATYVGFVVNTPPNPGGTPISYLGPLAEGFVAWTVGIGALFGVIYFTGTKASGARLHDRR